MNAQVSLMAGEAMPPELHALLNSADGVAFEKALDVLVREREQRVFRALGLLARDLHDAVRRLGGDLAQEGVPGSVADARKHLEDVLEMSSQAAHRSLDFVERMRPQAEALSENASAVIDGTTKAKSRTCWQSSRRRSPMLAATASPISWSPSRGRTFPVSASRRW